MEIKKIYFDMDGVLADFDKGVAELAGCEIDEDEMWKSIKNIEHFYDKLDVMPGAKEMFTTIYEKYGTKCEVLTGIPKPKRGILTAGEDKIKWMHRVMNEEIKVNIVFKEDKYKFCLGKEYVLIDDYYKNVDSWVENGGTGILHNNPKETLEKLARIEQI